MAVNSVESVQLVQMKPTYEIHIWAYTYEYIIAFIYFAETSLGTTQLRKRWLAVAWLCLKNKTNLYKFAKYQTYASLLYWHIPKLGYKDEMEFEELISEMDS